MPVTEWEFPDINPTNQIPLGTQLVIEKARVEKGFNRNIYAIYIKDHGWYYVTATVYYNIRKSKCNMIKYDGKEDPQNTISRHLFRYFKSTDHPEPTME